MIPNGTFTITGPKGRRTFRVRTAKAGNLEGKRILAVLNGPDNTADYLGVGFVNDDDTVAVWRKHQGTQWELLAKSFGTIVTRADVEHADVTVEYGGNEYHILRASTCKRCNRKLTVPVSIHNGYGPECINLVGGAA